LLPNPLVRFSLSPGEPARTFNLTFTAFDSLGDSTAAAVPIRVVPPTPPTVTVRANGQLVSGALNIRTGAQIQFAATATDPDGLGYPLLNGAGDTTDIFFLWNFDGATPLSGSSSTTLANPLVRFDLAAGQSSRTFRVQLTVPDQFGATRITTVTVNVTR
jgi:hypothetical protein